ncbi:hypothetical protein AMEX_G565 [Astyanax mexicanus]|uniref:Uncharacterized protein n=1 Tax=Astyanax mexicanus TaxID=7994 RepID=A0A8T2MD37_ASTMX|nr:hypothetical protein AMEX_G565 [Astyanax mexicanus]
MRKLCTRYSKHFTATHFVETIRNRKIKIVLSVMWFLFQATGVGNQPCNSVIQYEKITESKSVMSTGKVPVKYFTDAPKTTFGSHEEFIIRIQNEVPGLQEVLSQDECDVILLFLPNVSCGGINPDAAREKLDAIAVSKPAVLVVLHYSIDPEKVILESSKLAAKRPNTRTVDCLFHEDKGLLKCCKNEEAVKTVKEWLQDLYKTKPTVLF